LAGYSSADPCHGVLLTGVAALQCKAGIIGANAGAAYDTVLFGVYIQTNATAGVLTIAGMLNTSGVAANMLITGSTTADYFWMPPQPILNNAAAFVFTPSITNLIWVFTRPYYGPEAPDAGGYTIR
jgi:hypothetical protein